MGTLVNVDNADTLTDLYATDGEPVTQVKTVTALHDQARCFVDRQPS
ncbi:hypothetical protein ThrDRAFT_03005 [Frankia casuarinae]|jgi:hypothetical protein|nr:MULTISPECIES: hypothetical protein [Frankia]KEZ37492.1 hypothetical protein CEDDRAFT_01119 [Frankia sp. CeD]ETA02157.1 hypothetical protein CcI6DRAFT_02332 [Frankia sp. CcI6]EYT91388.1 hypothetical protein ThrDRAFT_03005 [Frankia casuarinae]KDA42840.1 hypothetical protein BMG523Draft_02229 [Frankia sp. BMG5.23]KFB05974.1 hypothetical protein ALLO2DRAFT_01259 [Frankia sp. Allo2]